MRNSAGYREFVDAFLLLAVEKGWPPSIEEIAERLGISRQAAERRKLRLQVLGVIVSADEGHRAWRVDIERAIAAGVIECACVDLCPHCGAVQCVHGDQAVGRAAEVAEDKEGSE